MACPQPDPQVQAADAFALQYQILPVGILRRASETTVYMHVLHRQKLRFMVCGASVASGGGEVVRFMAQHGEAVRAQAANLLERSSMAGANMWDELLKLEFISPAHAPAFEYEFTLDSINLSELQPVGREDEQNVCRSYIFGFRIVCKLNPLKHQIFHVHVNFDHFVSFCINNDRFMNDEAMLEMVMRQPVFAERLQAALAMAQCEAGPQALLDPSQRTVFSSGDGKRAREE